SGRSSPNSSPARASPCRPTCSSPIAGSSKGGTMQFDATMILYAVVVAAVIGSVMGLYLFVASLGGEHEIVDRRLDDLSNTAWERPKQLLRRKSLSDGKSPWLAEILETASLRSLDRLVETSGIRMSTERVLFFAVIGTAMVFELLEVVGG